MKKNKDAFSQFYDKKLRREISNASLTFMVPGTFLSIILLIIGFVSVGLTMYLSYAFSAVFFVLALYTKKFLVFLATEEIPSSVRVLFALLIKLFDPIPIFYQILSYLVGRFFINLFIPNARPM